MTIERADSNPTRSRSQRMCPRSGGPLLGDQRRRGGTLEGRPGVILTTTGARKARSETR